MRTTSNATNEIRLYEQTVGERSPRRLKVRLFQLLYNLISIVFPFLFKCKNLKL